VRRFPPGAVTGLANRVTAVTIVFTNNKPGEAAMLIGTFTEAEDGYRGVITALALHVDDVIFSPVPVKQGDGPDFIVLANDTLYEIGAAWKKTSKNGKPFLSVKLDGPTLVQPINCALTQQPDGSYGLIWNRKKPPEETALTEEIAA
jgi:uncharacterized protein (DUF736 family)